MIPTINITPHSPANANKYNNIFEDTLSQLQNIRESVVKMKNSSTRRMRDGISNYSLVNAAILTASLPDLSSACNGNPITGGSYSLESHYAMWSPQQHYKHCYVNVDRRKSWTVIDELNASAGGTNKSISLSSLDSEEQETIRVTEARRRSARNSAGGISTHSLNEAELVRDFERIATKKNIANELQSRIPIQKSISTSSIVAKEDIKNISRHLTDSEDEHQSLLRAHTKIKIYDNVEKRRKRGSLFFRKKKDKAKMKSIGGQVTACDICGTSLNLEMVKDHQLDCKVRKKYVKSESGCANQDYYDGTDQIGNYNEDAPLIKCEFLNEVPIEAQDLGANPILGIELKEYDSWSPGVPKDLLKSLKETQIKRQEHIYEFIMTEKHHCETLLVMKKVFVDSLERHFPNLTCSKMFPRLGELTNLHSDFLKKLRLKQREQPVVDTIADVLLDFFSVENAQHLRLAYGEFCANHRSALEQFKAYMTSRDCNFSQWYKHCLGNPLLKKKGIPECILFVTQRLTKYPLLIEPLLKSARGDIAETDKLQNALSLVKELLVDVDACVAEKELRDRQIDICQRIDNKSFAIYKNKPFRKSDMGLESRRCLKFEGVATLMQGRSKMQLVMVIVLTDCLCFLIENSAHNKYTFFTPEHKAGVVPLHKLLIREKAGTESRGIYIISSNPLYPEMYELKVQTPKDLNIWIQTIRQAVLDCPSSDIIDVDNLSAEEKLRIGVNKREMIEKMRQKDIELALLLEEKLILQINLMQKDQKPFNNAMNGEQQQHQRSNSPVAMSAAQFLATYGSYKDISVGVDSDTAELWKKVLWTVQEISELAASVYTAATGQTVSRSVSSVGEKQSGAYASPILPKRAETFAGFDEKRSKITIQNRTDQDKLGSANTISPRLQQLEEKKPSINSSTIKSVCTLFPSPAENQTESAATLPSTCFASKDNNLALLQITHNLQTLFCIISQQMTTIQSLNLALYRENPKATYTHNDQLEELRNLQDRLQEEKTAWTRQKEQMERELEEKKTANDAMQERLKTEQEDIKQQREQLYRKLELLSNQGILLSPNTPLMITGTMLQQQQSTITSSKNNDYDKNGGGGSLGDALAPGTPPFQVGSSTVDRRKDKWRTASTMHKTSPVNILSVTNAAKVPLNVVKQQIPMKLSSLSSATSSTSCGTGGAGGAGGNFSTSAKVDKSASFSSPASSQMATASTAIHTTITQMFPLKLADKRSVVTTAQIVPQHSRTGSSPAIIQQPIPSATTYTVGQQHSVGKNSYTCSGMTTHAAHVVNDQNSPASPHNSASTRSSYSSVTEAGGPISNIQAKAEDEEIYF